MHVVLDVPIDCVCDDYSLLLISHPQFCYWETPLYEFKYVATARCYAQSFVYKIFIKT